MAASHADAENMKCAVCKEVYTSPRFLSCHHTFCLTCLEDLANFHGDVIPCPNCRASTDVPTEGVAALQVNFYFTDEALERARNAGDPRLCPIHPNELVDLYCIQCDQVICPRCMVAKHKGHDAEDPSTVKARYKEAITEFHNNLDDTIGCVTRKLQTCQNNEESAREKGTAVKEQIQSRHDAVVAMAGRYRDQALQELQAVSDSVLTLLAADTRRVQDELNSLLQLQARVQQALSGACDTEIFKVGKEITEGRESIQKLRELEDGLPGTTYRPGLHRDFTNEVEQDIRRYIGSPVTLEFSSLEEMEVVRVGRCGDGECREVHAVREREDRTVQATYGGPGGDFSKEREVSFLPNGSVKKSTRYGVRVSYVTRKCFKFEWTTRELRVIGSKGDRMFCIFQNCANRSCSVNSLVVESEGEETCTTDTVLIQPNVHTIHNFDANESGNLFAVIDEAKESNDGLRNDDREQVLKNSSRVVHLYSTTSDTPIATYTPPQQPFFPTDVCFYNDDFLLIADWMNDSVHVVQVTDNSLTFLNYLPSSGDIVQPTALNLDFYGQLLIGCGDGWILKHPFNIF